MSAWLSKWAPASGMLAGVLVAIEIFAAPPNSPGDNATGAQVIAWYGSHHTSDFVFDIIGGLAVLFLVLFAVALARQVRTGDRWLAHGALAGAVFGGVDLLTSVGFDTVLAQDHSRRRSADDPCPGLPRNGFPRWHACRASTRPPAACPAPASSRTGMPGLVLKQGGGHKMILPSLLALSHKMTQD
jgi:hypothetical protein